MKSRKTLNVLSVLSVLLIVGAAVFAWSVNAGRQTSTHAAATPAQVKDFQVNMGSGSVYQFHRLTQGTWGSTTSTKSTNIDSGTWQMSQGGKVIGTADLSEKIYSSVRGIAGGRYSYQIKMISTVPGLPSSSSMYYDYPVPSPVSTVLPADYSSIDESPVGDVAVKYTDTNYTIASPDIESNPSSNVGAYFTAGAGFGKGYHASKTMQSAINQQNDAYNNLLHYTSSSTAMEPPSSAVKSLSFRSAQLPLPLPLILFAAAGATMWFVGLIGSIICSHNKCGKNSTLLAIIFGIMSGVGTLVTLISGVSVSGYLTIAAAQANAGAGAQVIFARGAEWGYRMARLGIPWTLAHTAMPADIESGWSPTPIIDHLD